MILDMTVLSMSLLSSLYVLKICPVGVSCCVASGVGMLVFVQHRLMRVFGMINNVGINYKILLCVKRQTFYFLFTSPFVTF